MSSNCKLSCPLSAAFIVPYNSKGSVLSNKIGVENLITLSLLPWPASKQVFMLLCVCIKIKFTMYNHTLISGSVTRFFSILPP